MNYSTTYSPKMVQPRPGCRGTIYRFPHISAQFSGKTDYGHGGKRPPVSWAPVRIHGQIAGIADNWVLFCHLCG